jgi:hypothetical protein
MGTAPGTNGFLKRFEKFLTHLRSTCMGIMSPKQMVVQNFVIDCSHLLVLIIRIIFICDVYDLEYNSSALKRAID